MKSCLIYIQVYLETGMQMHDYPLTFDKSILTKDSTIFEVRFTVKLIF